MVMDFEETEKIWNEKGKYTSRLMDIFFWFVNKKLYTPFGHVDTP